MRVVIAGGHGQIALSLERMLAARGDTAVGLVRNPDHVVELHGIGADAIVCDLESAKLAELTGHLADADAAVFAAGAGPGSGASRKETVDRAAAVLFADAAQAAGIRRVLQVSAMGLDRAYTPAVDEVFSAYLRAKDAAERDLRGRDLDWTILRPGRLTNGRATGRVQLAESVVRGEISRTDVAAVLLALLDAPATARRTLELVTGDVPIPEAVAAATH